jgi:predicted transcriptional regulator
MARKPKDVTEAELAIMQLLWSKSAHTVREMAEQLYGEFGPSQNATVQKLLDRLEQKECVQRNRSTWPHTFDAVMQRSDLILRQLQETADKLCDGSLTPLLTHLVKTKSLSKDERKSLRNLLDELDGKKK